jgi:hypothetical protein
MNVVNGPRLTPDALALPDPRLLVPPGAIADLLAEPGPSSTVVYDYGILCPAGLRALHCPCGRTDHAGRAEGEITAHLAGAPVGTRAAILVRVMASDGTAGSAHLYAVAERGQDGITWPIYQGIHAPGHGVLRDALPDDARPPARAGRPPDPGSTTIARTA